MRSGRRRCGTCAASSGSKLAESLVTRGMELSPTYPSYLDMRNAIIQADVADNGGAHVKLLWKVFAHRGMGFFAGTVGGNDTSPVEDFSLPPAPGTPKGKVTGTVRDSESGAGVARCGRRVRRPRLRVPGQLRRA